MQQIMQTLSTLPVSIVILATRTHKRITHQAQQKTSRPYFVVRFFTVNIFLRLTVKILSFLRLTVKFLAVLRLTFNPIETLILSETIFCLSELSPLPQCKVTIRSIFVKGYSKTITNRKYNVASKLVQFKPRNLLWSSACSIILRTYSDDTTKPSKCISVSFRWVRRN